MSGDEQNGKPRSDTTREIVEELRQWSGKVLRKVKEEADTLSVKGRLKLDLASLKSRRGAELKTLGMKAYHLAEQGSLEFPGAESVVTRIRELTEQIHDREQKLKRAGQEPGDAVEPGRDRT